MIHSKSIQIATALLIFIFSFVACNNATSESKDEKLAVEIEENNDIQAENKEDDFEQTANISNESVKEIVKVYIQIKNALVESNAEIASTEAAKMQSATAGAEDELIQEITEDAKEIAQTKDVEVQRTTFEELSDNVYKLVKANGTNGTELYRQFCPMAMNNEGAYWLSSEKEIRNPYFGDRMLKCGSVKETLK